MPKGVFSRKRGALGGTRRPRPRVITTKTVTTGGGAGLPLGPPRTGGFYGPGVRRLRGERKAIDTSFAPAIMGSANADITLLNGVATGTDFTDRIGRKIIIRSLLIRAEIYPTITVNNQIGEQVRFMVVWDMQSNGAAPVTTDILKSATTAAPNNLNNRDRFKILVDKYLSFDPCTYTASSLVNGSPQTKVIKIYKPLYLETIYAGTTNAIGSIQSGSLWCFTLSGNGYVSTEWQARVRFEDA